MGPARDIAVRSNGDLFIGLLKARRESGGVVAMRPHVGGEPDSIVRFGSEPIHGVVLADDTTLYVSTPTAIYRYRFTGTALEPRKRIDTIVVGLAASPVPSHSLALDARGNLIVNIGALSNACQLAEGTAGSPGRDPCPELETAAGIWRFRTDKTNQHCWRQRCAAITLTGLRNALALAVNPGDTMSLPCLYGRDFLPRAVLPTSTTSLAARLRCRRRRAGSSWRAAPCGLRHSRDCYY